MVRKLPFLPTDPVARFGMAAACWSVGLFGLLRLGWVQERLLLPLGRLQQSVAAWHGGTGSVPVAITLECTGADVIALCLAATLAFPTAWSRRLLAAAGGLGLILVLNTVRIGTLSRVASTDLFQPLHLYVWPAVLLVATLAYVGIWMWATTRRAVQTAATAVPWRFVVGAGVLVGLYVAFTPWLLKTAALHAVGIGVAKVSVAIMNTLALDVQLRGAVVTTHHGSFIVTPECVATPLMPLYLAATLFLHTSLRRRLYLFLAFVPFFGGLAVTRLLVLALPAYIVDSPLFLVHGFRQLVLGAALVVAMAGWRHGRSHARSAMHPALGAVVLAAGVVTLGTALAPSIIERVGALLRVVVPHTLNALTHPGDTQGALLLLPGFQVGLFLGLWVAAFGTAYGRAFSNGLMVLLASQLALLVALGEGGAHFGWEAPAILLRTWAIAGPLLVLWSTRPKFDTPDPSGHHPPRRRTSTRLMPIP